MTDNGWDQWKQRVLFQLEQQAKGIEKLHEGQAIMSVEIARLQVKAGVWGFAAGLLPSIGLLIYNFV